MQLMSRITFIKLKDLIEKKKTYGLHDLCWLA